MVEGFFGWAEGYIENNITIINKLPSFLRKFIGKSGVAVARELLNLNYFITKKYTPQRWDDEMKGISEASGIPVNTLRQINLVPELLKASCSALGAWGKATASGNVLHVRALDWEEHAPISMWPAITVYHSTE